MNSIRFAGDLPPWLVLIAAVASAVLVMSLYLRETRSLALPYSYLLPALRASAVVLVILILAGPVLHRRQVVGSLGRVIFAIDTSQSMSESDSTDDPASPLRLDRVANWLTGDDQRPGWLESLSQSHDIDVIGFSSKEPTLLWSSRDGEEIPTALPLTANGSRTDLSSPLATVLATFSPEGESTRDDESAQRAAVVLMTDGRDNAGPSPIEMAERLRQLGAGVHAIGIGSEDEPADVGIVGVERPDSVASDGRLSGVVLLHQHEMEGKELTLRIESSGETVWQKTVTASSTERQSVPFEIDVESVVKKLGADTPRGVRRSSVVMDLRAVIDPVVGDASADNNTTPFRVAASTRDRTLLIVDGSSRWETRYLRNLFQRDPAWQVETLLYGPGTDMPRVVRGDKAGQFPNTLEAISGYDAIILGEIPPDQFSIDDAKLISEFVTRGGGLVLIDGRYDRLRQLADDKLRELIPVSFVDGGRDLDIRSIRPSRMGSDHPVMNLWGDKEQISEFWEQLPTPSTASRIRAQEGAEVWADVVGQDGRESPWLVTRLYGAGRVFYLSTDQTWRWRYKVADRFHARFWNQLLAAVMQPPYAASDDYVALGTDKIEYEAGETSTVRVRLQDTSGQPVGGATVDALLIAGDRVVATVPLTVDDPARGTYRGQTPPLAAGSYEVRIRASGFDAAALQATTPIWVGQQDLAERRRVSQDRNALVQIAEAGGGLYLHESAADEILESLRPLSDGSVVESDILIWQSYYWFWAVILILAVEWWMRKRAGLV